MSAVTPAGTTAAIRPKRHVVSARRGGDMALLDTERDRYFTLNDAGADVTTGEGARAGRPADDPAPAPRRSSQAGRRTTWHLKSPDHIMRALPKEDLRQRRDSSDHDFSALLDAVLPEGAGALALIHAYMDESGTHKNSQVMCIAGYLFQGFRAKLFTRDWGRILRGEGLQYFRMSECAPGAGQFRGMPLEKRMSIAGELIRLIHKHTTFGFAVVISERDYLEQATPQAVRHHGQAYTLCMHSVLATILRWTKRARYTGSIAYFIESGHAHQREANDRLTQLAADELSREQIHYASHSFVDKRIARPLDAADMLAWQLNKFYIDTLSRRGPGRRRMRGAFKALMAPTGRVDDNRYDFPNLTAEGIRRYLDDNPVPPAAEREK
jgi:hypothetical protein